MANPALKNYFRQCHWFENCFFTSRVEFLIIHIFNAFSIFLLFSKRLSKFVNSNYMNNKYRIFSKHRFVKSIHFPTKSVTMTLFRPLIAGISHLLKLGFKTVNDEEIWIAFSNLLIEFKFFKENVELSDVYTDVYTDVYFQICLPLHYFHCFFMEINRISKHKIKWYMI